MALGEYGRSPAPLWSAFAAQLILGDRAPHNQRIPDCNSSGPDRTTYTQIKRAEPLVIFQVQLLGV
jgi:hypothetical protein